MPNLREAGIGVDENTHRNVRHPWPKGIDARDVQHHIRRVAKLQRGCGCWSQPATSVGIVVRPSLSHVQALERASRKRQPIRRIVVGHVAERIVTGRIVVAVFEEEHIMAEPTEADDVLQIMPGNSAEWSSHQIAQDEDPQSGLVHETAARLSNDVSSMC